MSVMSVVCVADSCDCNVPF